MEKDKKVLIIDDDPRNIFALQLALKSRGYDSISCQSAAEAISLLKSEESIRVLLLDMMMPDIDGYQAIQGIKNAQLTNCPIIAVTARAMEGDKERCLAAGANGYVSKPVDIDELIREISDLTGGNR